MEKNKFPQMVKTFISQYNKKLNMDKKGKITVAAIGIICIMAISIIIYNSNTAYAVKINGNIIAVVREQKDFSTIVDKMKANLNKAHGTEIVFNQNISYEKTKAKDQELTGTKELENKLKQAMDFKVKAYGIKANDEIVAVLSKKTEAEKVLTEVKNIYANDSDTEYEKIYFGEKVEVDEVTTEIKNIKGDEDALKLILQGTDETKIHEVQQGESFWTIAKKYNISVDDLIKSNSHINPDKLQIKEKVNLIVAKPLITVATVEKKRYEEEIPFEIVFEETSALYKGEKKVKSQGKNGRREVLAEIVKHNGVEISRNILEEKILMESQKQVVLKGTKNPPPKIGTGSLSNPTRGTLTSRFGWRWGRKHEGIDIAAKIGTAVKAADGGKVIFSGTKSGYGKCIIIDHGGGVQTLYGHNSKLLVSKGDKVFKGEKIAEVGNTGRSTGPHLHFEVRKNGAAVNPLKYVKY